MKQGHKIYDGPSTCIQLLSAGNGCSLLIGGFDSGQVIDWIWTNAAEVLNGDGEKETQAERGFKHSVHHEKKTKV